MSGNSVFDATANSATLNWQGVNVIQIGAGTDGNGHPSVGTVTVGGNSILRNGMGPPAISPWGRAAASAR